MTTSNPELAVQVAILDCFANVLSLDVHGGGQVGNGARHFQDTVAGPGAEIMPQADLPAVLRPAL